ncbi:MAG: acyl carrier protein [Lacunisphaera sp.]
MSARRTFRRRDSHWLARFGLDSVDALELVLALEKEFGVKIGSSEESRQALATVNSLAAFLRAHETKR